MLSDSLGRRPVIERELTLTLALALAPSPNPNRNPNPNLNHSPNPKQVIELGLWSCIVFQLGFGFAPSFEVALLMR